MNRLRAAQNPAHFRSGILQARVPLSPVSDSIREELFCAPDRPIQRFVGHFKDKPQLLAAGDSEFCMKSIPIGPEAMTAPKMQSNLTRFETKSVPGDTLHAWLAAEVK